jgi:hypothetical protein
MWHPKKRSGRSDFHRQQIQKRDTAMTEKQRRLAEYTRRVLSTLPARGLEAVREMPDAGAEAASGALESAMNDTAFRPGQDAVPRILRSQKLPSESVTTAILKQPLPEAPAPSPEALAITWDAKAAEIRERMRHGLSTAEDLRWILSTE